MGGRGERGITLRAPAVVRRRHYRAWWTAVVDTRPRLNTDAGEPHSTISYKRKSVRGTWQLLHPIEAPFDRYSLPQTTVPHCPSPLLLDHRQAARRAAYSRGDGSACSEPRHSAAPSHCDVCVLSARQPSRWRCRAGSISSTPNPGHAASCALSVARRAPAILQSAGRGVSPKCAFTRVISPCQLYRLLAPVFFFWRVLFLCYFWRGCDGAVCGWLQSLCVYVHMCGYTVRNQGQLVVLC